MAGHRHGPGRIPEKPKNFKGTLRKLLHCLGAYRFALALVLVLALASTAFGIVGPKILSTATTELATGLGRKLSGLGGIDFGKIGKILLTVLALYLVSAACSFFQSWILAGVTQKLAYRLRGEISAKIHRMPMRYLSAAPSATCSRASRTMWIPCPPAWRSRSRSWSRMSRCSSACWS